MIVVGELINASRKKIGQAIMDKDAEYIRSVARSQYEAGADYIDVNAGIFVEEEADYIKWLVEVVQQEVDAPCSIDSPSPAAIEAALTMHRGTPMINSISLEKERYETLMPIVAGTDFKVVALCMSDEGMPETVDDRLEIADKLVNGLLRNNVDIDNIYVDPLVQPISTNKDFGTGFLNSVEQIIKRFEGVHTMCGLSNISFGLPNRQFLNQLFAVMAISKGLDGLIINPLDRRMMANMIAAEALAGRDQYCANYLQGFRQGLFDI
ncbi:methyltetrahydrofolate cobalamin methyltransferase [Desulforhopalus singaporensis]|uniref:5-methyltetrahydrofolate--homocysteine methyltransferase n=1 Tax=Desulforhopalus singaporensis TaxID=91360 RepID=A0A1H0IY86_9BACT|nr:methyltetrahydrofolate cobalamin methyltransferase [Desulforhopalus singaporensis]SDO36406.1 5-methyltetrahydrofolate--homocysteine methyltransferase [Desulforhopalus singaporensis]